MVFKFVDVAVTVCATDGQYMQYTVIGMQSADDADISMIHRPICKEIVYMNIHAQTCTYLPEGRNTCSLVADRDICKTCTYMI